jgi:hypothetical protein
MNGHGNSLHAGGGRDRGGPGTGKTLWLAPHYGERHMNDNGSPALVPDFLAESRACWAAAERSQVEAQRTWARAAAIADRTTGWIRILFWFGILPCGVFSFVTMIFIVSLMIFPGLATWIMSF